MPLRTQNMSDLQKMEYILWIFHIKRSEQILKVSMERMQYFNDFKTRNLNQESLYAKPMDYTFLELMIKVCLQV